MTLRLATAEPNESPSEQLAGGWFTPCWGMPTLAGCPNEIQTIVPYVRPGLKKSGWLLTYAWDDVEKQDDKSMLLAFCPECAQVVIEQERRLADDNRRRKD